ncbi:transposase [Trichonephila inaurata madagascariensis]|uniref:Transposase n=1 Tax=Trichonephila inaurata madagascariensis TaxID=2747483 RepID=A0A8X6YLU9_9ARAC|nr:transposase [Trichonephila inaurata madagascariensis]
MSCDHKLNNLHSMRFAKKLGAWAPHELNKSNKENRLQIASQHLDRHRVTRGHKQRFLYRIVTEDEKWCLYINMYQRKEWRVPTDTPKPRVKHDLHPKKTIVSVWWDLESMVHWQILERNVTFNKELYIPQVHRVKEAFRLKKPIDSCTSRQTPKPRTGGPFASTVFSGPCIDELSSLPLPIAPYDGRYLRQ